VLARLGDVASARKYIDWLAGMCGPGEAPLQILYQIDGGTQPRQVERKELAGYRGSRPVRFGNHAFRQQQLDAFGFLAVALNHYLDAGGEFDPSWWTLLDRVAEYVVRTWQEPDNGIWELTRRHLYVSSRVGCWVTLTRLQAIAEKTGQNERSRALGPLIACLHAEVMDRGYDDEAGAFRQRYDARGLDAAALLVPLFGFLPANHPRVRSTIAALQARLSVDQFLYRFDPADVDGLEDGLGRGGVLGEFEAAFLPSTLWLAGALALAGQRERARAILDRVDTASGPLGLLAEAVDPRTGAFVGNTPLLFSHACYVEAALLIDAGDGPPG
jgi:GH15 family glucan-1,4-alpha-glucosidase